MSNADNNYLEGIAANLDTAHDALEAALQEGRFDPPTLRRTINSNDSDYKLRAICRLALADKAPPDSSELLLANLREFDYAAIPGVMYELFNETYIRIMRKAEPLSPPRESSEWSREIVRALTEVPDNNDGIDVRQSAVNIAGALNINDTDVVDALIRVVTADDPYLVAPLALDVLEGFSPDLYKQAWDLYKARPDADNDLVALRS